MKKKIQVTPVVTGYFRLPLGAFFGVAEPVVRKKYADRLDIDTNNRVFLAVRGLLVRAPDGIFIVEPGLGTKTLEYADKYNAPVRFSWSAILKCFDLFPEHITGVLSSHLHWDHAGGNTEFQPKSVANAHTVHLQDPELSPTFPKATYFLHERELQHAQDAKNHRLPQSYDARDIPPKERIKIVKESLSEIAPGIRLELTGGHTPGHCVIHIESEERRHVFIGDIAPTLIHLTEKGGYEMAFDDDASTILERKRGIIKRAKEENWRLYLVHDPSFAFIDGEHLADK